MYFDRKGNPMSMMEWDDKVRDYDYKIIKQDKVKIVSKDKVDEYLVSTIWLGLNHAHFESHKLIFETMIFKVNSSRDVYMERYSTEEQAIEGHSYAVENLDELVRQEETEDCQEGAEALD